MTDLCDKDGDNFEFSRLLSAATFIRKLGIQVELRNFPFWGMDPLKYICEKRNAIFLVRVYSLNKVDHCIVFNARRCIVVDILNRYPMQLSKQVLKLAGGSNAVNVLVGELWELVPQRVSTK